MAQINWTKKSLKDLKAINDYISLDSKFSQQGLFLNSLNVRNN